MKSTSHESREERRAPGVKTYLLTFAALLFLLGATYGASHLRLGVFGPVVAVSIATAKTLVILLYFMHLRYSSRLTWLFAIAGFFWLGILFVLALGDYLTRAW